MCRFIFRDNVEWDSDQEHAASQKIMENSEVILEENEQGILLNLPK